MPIETQHKQAFIHIPKCGGTTIEKRYNLTRKECFFEGKYDAYDIDGVIYAPQHLPPKHLATLVPQWTEFNTFCFVRNPIEKMVSEYFQLHTHFYKKPRRYFHEPAFRRWLEQEAAQFKMDHTLPQWYYAKDCKHTFRLQDLQITVPMLDEWFNHIGKKPLKHEKKGGTHWTKRGKKEGNKSISKALSNRTLNLIKSVYEIDFDHLSHKF